MMVNHQRYPNWDFVLKNCFRSPAKKCNGKCYLKNRLKQNDQEEERIPPKKNLTSKLTYVLPNSNLNIDKPDANFDSSNLSFRQRYWRTSDWKYKLLRPPISVPHHT